VLEVGAGTGYNAALLACRAGAALVTTVEIDPSVAAHASQALRGAGFGAVRVVVGDGSAGYPAGAPYDRVLSTAACHRVPYTWVAQSRPGGRIVTPWRSDFYHCALLALTVGQDGTATGRIVGKAAFMDLRDQRVRRVSFDDVHHEDQAVERSTPLHPYQLIGDHDAATAIGIRVPRLRYLYTHPEIDSDDAVLWLIDPWSGSWARVHDPRRPVHSYRVRSYGPRDVWAEVHAAYDWWTTHGRPRADRWRFTIAPDHQRIELDSSRRAAAARERETEET